jgi:hypothetical protein
MGMCPSPSGGAFLTTATVTSFPLSKIAGPGLPLLSSLSCLFTVHMREYPSPTLRSSGCPTLFVTYLFFFFSCLFIIQGFVSFFPGQGSVCPGCYADLSQGVLHAAYLLTWCSPNKVGAGFWWQRCPPCFSV